MLKPVENSIKYEVKEKCLTLAMPLRLPVIVMK